MKWIINYIRSCFCKHEWELLYHEEAESSEYCWRTKKHQWIYRCNKCGCKNIIKN